MTAVRNRAVVARVAAREYRAGRARNRWTIAAVALASFLVVTVLSVGVAYVQALDGRGTSWTGITWDALVAGPTVEQIDGAAAVDNVAVAGLRVGIGTIVGHAGRDAGVDLLVSGETNWARQVLPAVEWSEGRYPAADDEILLSAVALEQLGVSDPRLGMTLDLDFRFRDLGYRTWDAVGQGEADPLHRTFTLVGRYDDQTGQAVAYGSQALLEESGVPVTDVNASTLYLTLENPYLDAAGVARLSDGLGIDRSQSLVADDTGLRKLVTAVVAMVGLVLLVGASAALVVHSLLSIWLGQQIRVHGLLATIGTTGRQLRGIVRRQVVRIGVVGTLLGVGAAVVVCAVLLPRLLAALLPWPPTVSATSVVLVVTPVAILLVGVTLAVSARGSLRAVAASTPVDALRHLPAPVRRPRATARTGSPVARLAGRALARDRRRTATIVTSFVLALVTCLTTSALVASNDSARVLDQQMPADLVLSDTSEHSTIAPPDARADRVREDRALDLALVADVRDLEGVAAVSVFAAEPVTVPLQPAVPEEYVAEFFDRFTYYSWDEARADVLAWPGLGGTLVGLDDAQLAELNVILPEPVDPADFRSGRAAVLSAHEGMEDWDAEAAVGHDVRVLTADGVAHALPVAAVTSEAPTAPLGVVPDLLVGAEYLESVVADPLVQAITVTYERAFDRETEAAVLALVGEGAPVDRESKIDLYDAMRDGAQQIRVLGTTIAGVMLVVALLNFVSAIVATARARVRELALLEAVGATRRQLRRSAVVEGLGYWALAAPASVALAVPLGAAAFGATNEFGTSYAVPLGMFAAVLVAVAVLCATVPVVALRGARRGSLVDRLR